MRVHLVLAAALLLSTAATSQPLNNVKTKAEYRRQVDEQIRLAHEKGYKDITFKDFLLDGRDLSKIGAKVSIGGIYLKTGDLEILYPNPAAAILSHNSGPSEISIGLVTDDAERPIRKYLLECRGIGNQSIQGCPVVVLGHVSMCTRSSLAGSVDMPCIIMESGWHIPSP